MNNYVVYKHTNTINGMVYIGMTNNTKRRWRNNGIEYKPERENSSRFWNAINEYGWNKFTHEVLVCELSFADACAEEKRLIKKYHSQDKLIGYNIASGGNGGLIYQTHPRGMKGKHQTRYQIEHQREFMSHSENQPMRSIRWGITNPHPRGMLGHHQTALQKQVASERTGIKNANSMPMTIYKPDGSEEHFVCATDCYKKYNFYKMWKLLKTGTPYELPANNIPNRKKCASFNGWIFKYDKRKYRDNLSDREKADKHCNA